MRLNQVLYPWMAFDLCYFDEFLGNMVPAPSDDTMNFHCAREKKTKERRNISRPKNEKQTI